MSTVQTPAPVEVPSQGVPSEPSELSTSVLSDQEETFALALVECNGNDGAAYMIAFPEERFPYSRAVELLKARPAIAARVAEITKAREKHDTFSLVGHMYELAKIRDVALSLGQPKVALTAEQRRGEVMGHGFRPEDKNKGPGEVNIFVNVGGKTTPIEAHRVIDV